MVKLKADGTTHIYTYNQAGQLIQESRYSVAKALQQQLHYIWLGDKPVGLVIKDSSSDDWQIYAIHSDHLNTPRLITDQDGAEVWRWSSDAFGEGDTQGSITFNLRFPGQYYDEESGLHYNYFRDYNAATGRYVQSDPIGLYDGPNTYTYVYNNPLIYTDPTGEFGIVGAGIGALIDLGGQLAANGGNFKCVNWGSVAVSAGMGAIGGGLANGLVKGAFKFKKTGSHSFGALKHWGKTNNIKALKVKPGQHRHHWLAQQNQGWLKNLPNSIKNQPWNLNPVGGKFNGWMARGNTNLRSLLGAPPWARGVAGGAGLIAGGKAANAAGVGGGGSCGCP